MADEITQPMAETAPAEGGGLRAFLGTTGGKLVVGGAAVGILALVGVVVVVVVLLFSSKPAVNQGVVPIKPVSSASTSTIDGDDGKPVIPPAVPDSEIFTFRDVFKPLIAKATDDSKKPAVPGSTTTSATPGAEDTLYLEDVTVEDGVNKAVLSFNGTAYTLGEGEVVGSTPWKVLTVDASSDSVVMLYGDSQVTLAVGQGTSSGK